jgi:ferredoxin--NADP+ reductase
MTHVITQNCCNDAACIPACPVDCIHPRPDDPDYRGTEMLYIDPGVCIDCGACVEVCPVDAIQPDSELSASIADYLAINRDFFAAVGRKAHMEAEAWLVPSGPQASNRGTGGGPSTLTVAVVGAGPAGQYAAEALLSQSEMPVRVDMFDRLCTPGGLVRFGVAPDHERTKRVQRAFAETMSRPGLRMFLNVTVGEDITHDQLKERYHAVIYAVGASVGRALGIPGEDLVGSYTAADFVAWYNGHPDHADRAFDLSCSRAVILGNGNVALDVARLLTVDPDQLAKTDVADHALAALRSSNIREVMVVGRRGPLDAAFSTPELLGLAALDDVDVIVDVDDVPREVEPPTDAVSFSRALKADALRQIAARPRRSRRAVTLKFFASPIELIGRRQVQGIRLSRNEVQTEGGATVVRATDRTEAVECGLVLRAIGYRGIPSPGVPFDDKDGILPNQGGRALERPDGPARIGVYTTGWYKRGPSGVIGTNKQCAKETVSCVLQDFKRGLLSAPATDPLSLDELLPHHITLDGARAIDAFELDEGRRQGRPRVKVVSSEALLRIGQAGQGHVRVTARS